ncbi:hypothetical protein Plhal304r1_c074g0161991 [Plasmopara halstedii]
MRLLLEESYNKYFAFGNFSMCKEVGKPVRIDYGMNEIEENERWTRIDVSKHKYH